MQPSSSPQLPNKAGIVPEIDSVPWKTRLFLAGVVCLCLAIVGSVGVFLIYPLVGSQLALRQARQALAAYDLPRARERLQQGLRLVRDQGEAHFLLARACRLEGDFDAAREHLAEAERLRWAPADVNLERLLLRAQAGLVRSVEKPLRQSLQARPEDAPLILEALVRGTLSANFLDQAYRWGRLWTERCPDDARAHFWNGRILEAAVRYDLAADAYQQALALKPDFVDAQLSRAEVLRLRRRFTEAQPHYEDYLAARPQEVRALVGLARCQRSLGRLAEARTTLERLTDPQAESADSLTLRGQLELDADRPEAALDWLAQALKLAPLDLDAHQAMANALRRLKRDAEAEIHERKKAEIERDLQRLEDVLKAVPAASTDVELRYEAGMLLLRLGHEQQAMPWLVSALLVDRNHKQARQLLGECLRRLGDSRLVRAYQRLLQEEAPDLD